MLGRIEETRQTPVIFASNHQSFIDPLVIGSVIRQEIFYFAKQEIFEWFFIRDLARFFNAFPTKRGNFDMEAIRFTKRILQGGQSLLMFPEGTRSKTGELQEARSGVAMLAFQNKVDIVPIHIQGTFKLRKSFLRYPGIMVNIGNRIPINEFLNRQIPRKKLYQELSDRIMREIAELRNESLVYQASLRGTK